MALPKFSNVPIALSSVPNWLLWKNVISTQYPRGKKIPIDANTFGAGSSTDPKTWSTFETVSKRCVDHKYSGVGFSLIQDVGIFCIDIDECIVEGKLTDHATEVVERFRDKTYIEGSFHKDGIHIFGYGKLPDCEKGGKRKQILCKENEIEVYSKGRYIAVTGWKFISSNPIISDCQSELDELLKDYEKPKQTTIDAPKTTRSFNGGTITDKLGLSCSQIARPTNAIVTSNGYQGAHPIHGSSTGSNFCINEHSNTWYCFRHNCGGGALELYAMSKGIIECDDAGRGCFDGKWSELFEALEKDGYKLNKDDFPISIMKKRADTEKLLKSYGVL